MLRNTIKIPIEVTKGTDAISFEFTVRDYNLPVTAAAVAYAYRMGMKKPNSTLCDVSGNVISFQPSANFFEVGNNELQIRVINEDKSLISFKEKVKCSDSIGFSDDEEEKQQTLVEQLVSYSGKETGERKAADEAERQERIAGDAQEKVERQAEIATERARINQFTKLAAGSTTGDAELIDGRTDVDGNVHDNIGDAMRGQTRKLRENLVVRQKEQPTDPNNNVWISDEDDEVEVPDMGEFNSLKEDLANVINRPIVRRYYNIYTQSLPVSKEVTIPNNGNIGFSFGDWKTNIPEGEYFLYAKFSGELITTQNSKLNIGVLLPLHQCTIQLGIDKFNEGAGYGKITVSKISENEALNIKPYIQVTDVVKGTYTINLEKFYLLSVDSSFDEDKIIEGINYYDYPNEFVEFLNQPEKEMTYPSVFSGDEILLPSSIMIMNGIQTNIFIDNLLYKCQRNLLYKAEWSTGVTNTERFGQVQTLRGDTSTVFSIQKKNDYAKSIDGIYKNVLLKLVDSQSGRGKTIRALFIGDSLTDANLYTQYLLNRFSEDDCELVLLGTRGNENNKHEGRSGWRAYTYTHYANAGGSGSSEGGSQNVSNPFWNTQSSSFDFAYYMQNQGYDGVDVVCINLGTNDYIKSTDDNAIYNDYMTIINSMKEYDASIKICIWLPPTRGTLNRKSNADFGRCLLAERMLISKFDKQESNNIYLVPVYLCVDNENDYSTKTLSIDWSDVNVKIPSDLVHFASSGHHHVADMYYVYLKYISALL